MAILLAARETALKAYGMQQPSAERSQGVSSNLNSVPEIKKLAFLLGNWTAIDQYESTAFIPHGGSGSGIYKTVLGPGGFSVLTDYSYDSPLGHASGFQILTWDPMEKRYVGFIVISSSPGYVLIAGDWDGPTFALSGEFEHHGVKVRFRQVFSDISEGTMILRQYNSIDGGPAQLFGTTKFTRK